MERVRSFVAIELPVELKRRLAAVQAELELAGARVRWAVEETLHLTLKFLGDVERPLLVDVARAVEQLAVEREPWEVELAGLGRFPATGAPHIIWVGVGAGRSQVVELAEALERALEPLGFRPEARRFHPHLTLGRVRSGRGGEGLVKALAGFADRRLGVFQVESVATFESELRPEGPKHTVVATAWLGVEESAESGSREE